MTRVQKSPYLNAVFLGSGAFVFINFGLPVRADDLGISATAIGGMYAVFTATMLLFRPLVGYCLDRFGRRWFFASAFMFYSAAMIVFARSTDLTDFYIARFLQGIGASLMWVSARTMVADVLPIENRAEGMGQLLTISVRGSMLGAVYGFTLLGMMPMAQAWIWAFSGYAVLALLGWVWALTQVKETRIHSPPAMVREKLQWTPPLRRILIIVFISGFASALIEPVYLLFLKQKFDLHVTLLALAFLPAGLVYAILPRYAGRWADKFGRVRLIAAGIVCAGLVSAALPFWPGLMLVAASYILFAVGWALAGPAEDALVADLAPPGLLGTVLGAREAAAGFGAALGPLAGGFIYDHVSQAGTFVFNGVLLGLAAILVLIWYCEPEQRRT
ncbi:MAG: MFS transporter [bacterium]